MINFKFFACEPRVYYPLRNPYYIDSGYEIEILNKFAYKPMGLYAGNRVIEF